MLGSDAHGVCRRRFVTVAAVGMAIAAAGVGGGCASPGSESPYGSLAGNQRYPYDDVKRRLKSLQKGATKAQVYIALGAPAKIEGSDWLYLPERSGLIFPAEALKVRFEYGRYVSHSFQPIVLGERLGS